MAIVGIDGRSWEIECKYNCTTFTCFPANLLLHTAAATVTEVTPKGSRLEV